MVFASPTYNPLVKQEAFGLGLDGQLVELGLGNGESPLHAAGFQPEEVHLAAMNFSPVLSVLNPVNPPRDVHRDDLHKGWKGKGLQALLTSVVKDYSKSTGISRKKLGDFLESPLWEEPSPMFPMGSISRSTKGFLYSLV